MTLCVLCEAYDVRTRWYILVLTNVIPIIGPHIPDPYVELPLCTAYIQNRCH